MNNVILNPWFLFKSQLEKRHIASVFETNPAAYKESRFTNVCEMTVYETSIWVWTLGYFLGWPEAQFYAKSFSDNDIAGSSLPSLSLRMLENHLGIRNRSHCMAIKREIDFCFPSTKESHFRVQIEMGLGDQRRGSVGVGSMDECMASTFMRTGSVSVSDMSDSVTSTNTSLSVNSKLSRIVPRRRCLVLTLRSEQKVPDGQKQHIKNQFAKLSYNVEIRSGEKNDSYILEFDDEEKALKANAQSKKFGYQLAKYRPRRPSANNPVVFKVLSPVTVRVGKGLKGKIIKMLEKDDIIPVNKVKGRRARVILDGGRVGWVSLHSDKGYQLLERCEHAHEIYC